MTSTDAKAIDVHLQFIQQTIVDVADKLSSESVVKMVFLFSDLMKLEQFSHLLNRVVPRSTRIYALVKIVLAEKKLQTAVALNVWAELLFLTKNYCFLKTLQTCKHVMKDRYLRGSPYFSSEFRRLLISLADDMADNDMMYIWGQVHSDSDRPTQPELLFHQMILDQLISKSNVRELCIHFNVLNRSDLQSKAEEYSKKIGMLSRTAPQYDVALDAGLSHCGLALIFNNKTFDKPSPMGFEDNPMKKLEVRHGTENDAKRLEHLWEAFGIKSLTYSDTESSTFLTLLNDHLQGNLSRVKIFIVCLLTHGNLGLVYGSDRVPVEIKRIEQLLGTSESLAGKPKLLFVQACQGMAVQRHGESDVITESYEFDLPNQSGERQRQNPVPQYCDMLVGMSTVPTFMSMRHNYAGSHFIQTLVDVLETSTDQEDILELTKEVNYRVTQKWVTYRHKPNEQVHRIVQMPTFSHQLTKRLVFKKAAPFFQCSSSTNLG